MYTRFYDDTIVTRFIKYLLANTYTPLVRVWNPGGFALSGSMYIHQGKIMQAKKTGFLDSITDFDVKQLFIPTRCYYGINSTYSSNTNGYDPVTHRWLGNYLRFIRDYYGVNLMPFYNCFCGEFVSNVDIKQVTSDSGTTYHNIVSSTDSRSKIFVVPVRFGQTYNLAIDCDTGVEFMYGFYGPKGLIVSATDTLRVELRQTHYTKLPSCQFTNPCVVPPIEWSSMPSATQNVAQFEKYLRLFVKIPQSSESSIAVIEGNIQRYNTLCGISDKEAKERFSTSSAVYSNILNTCNSKTVEGYQVPQAELYFKQRQYDPVTKTRGEDATQTFSSRPIEECLGPLGLLQWSDGNTYAFSNRLVEYLLWNVVDSIEPINKNVERVQGRITSLEMSNANLFPRYRGAFTSGVWDENMQKYIYALRKSIQVSPKGVPSVDYNGFVDKDTETILNRGRKR